MTAEQLRAERHKLAMQARKLVETAHAEKRDMSAEETAQFDRAMADVDAFDPKIEKAEKDERNYARLLEIDAESRRSAGRRTTPAPVEDRSNPDDEPRTKSEKRAARLAELRARADRGDDVARRSLPEYETVFRSYLLGGYRGLGLEARALQADADIQGGFLVLPTAVSESVIMFVKDLVFMRGLATVETITDAQSLGVPTLDADPADADWTAEILTGSEDSTMKFGRRDLSPHPVAKRIKVSAKLLRLARKAESIVLDRLGYKFAVTEEKAFLVGSGAQQPLGVFTASASGIDTGRDVSTGNSTTAIAADGLIEAKYNLKAQYLADPSCAWIFHRAAVKNIRKLKDGNGQYLWAPGLGGNPDTILDLPFKMSEYAPSTFTTGLYVGIIGAFRYYQIVDALNMSVQRLDELYAETNQVGFIGRKETDAMPVLAEAFTRVKLA